MIHHIDVKTVDAACCEHHTTWTAECCCGWRFNERRSNLQSRGEVEAAIRGHRLLVIEEALKLQYDIRWYNFGATAVEHVEH